MKGGSSRIASREKRNGPATSWQPVQGEGECGASCSPAVLGVGNGDRLQPQRGISVRPVGGIHGSQTGSRDAEPRNTDF